MTEAGGATGLDSRLRGNDGGRSRCAGGTGLDSRLRGNDGGRGGTGLDSRLRGNDAWSLVLSEKRRFATTVLYDLCKTGFALMKR